ncbi:hypothetical protein A9Q84_12260 [Halobacteriovorax marinus]|uniref:Helicase n=1 Tax=Halobacteriovorax marinus TaxID=97084 RepID=A0A1Y5F826_9BACT|nr:hypothetical protein A9Q84_12260 [Halobacteriovorax marinus]
MIPNLVDFSNKCAHYFDEDQKKRGQSLFEGNALRIFHSHQQSLKAYTLKPRIQNVTLDWVQVKSFLAIKSYCDCNEYKLTDRCAHLWATILGANAEQFPTEALSLSKIDFISTIEERTNEDIFKRNIDHFVNLDNALNKQKLRDEVTSSVVEEKEKNLSFKLNKNLEMQSHLLRIDFLINEKSIQITDKIVEDLNIEDRAIIEILRRLSTLQGQTYWQRKKVRGKNSFCEIPLESLDLLLPMICKYQLVDEFANKLEYVINEKLICHNRLDDKKNWSFIPFFKLNTTNIELNEMTIIRNMPLGIYDGKVYKIDYRGLAPLVEEFKLGRTTFKKEEVHVQDIKDFIFKYPTLSKVEVPTHLKFKTQDIVPKIRMNIDISSGPAGSVIWSQFISTFEEEWHSPMSPMTLQQEDGRVLRQKHEIKEKILYEEIANLLSINLEKKDFSRKVKIKVANFGNTIQNLVNLGIEVFATNKRVTIPKSMGITLQTEEDWFEIKSNLEFEEESFHTPKILAMAKNSLSLVPLKNGTLGLLPEEWLKKHLHLEHLADQKDERFLIAKDYSLYLDILFEEKMIQADTESYSTLLEKLKNAKKAPEVKIPKSFNGVLRDYQTHGVQWLQLMDNLGLGGCLADEMGLGKTVQILCHLEILRIQKRNKNIIIVPKSLIHNWKNEAKKFCPKMKVIVYEGTKAARKLLLETDFDLLICTYGIVRNDIAEIKDTVFDTILLDEAQHIKNAQSLTAKSVNLLQSNNRFIITGTPVENNLSELFSLFKFLSPRVFGTGKITKENLTSGNESVINNILKGLRPLILRRLKKDVLKDLPDKNESILPVVLSSDQKKIYEEIKEHYRTKLMDKVQKVGIKKSKIHILEALLRLRQAACHPGLINPQYMDSESSKLEVLVEKLTTITANGEKALVFSQFTQFLKIVKNRLDKEGVKYCYLDGQTNNREQVVEEFKNSSEKTVFLISLKAGGYGLNLTEANYCFLLDPWWNPAVEGQAIDRMHRIGQNKEVFAFKLLSVGTVEEKIIKMQEKKKKLIDNLLFSNETVLKDIDSSDLVFLFS